MTCCYCTPVAAAEVPTELVRVTVTEAIALEDPLSVKGMVSENAPPYVNPLLLANQFDKSEDTFTVKFVPLICAPAAALKVKVAV